jgi:hypothetical protein
MLTNVGSAAEVAPPAPSPCPVSTLKPCILTLEGPGAPSASPACSSDAWSKLLSFTQPGRWADSDSDRSWESVLELRLDPRKDCGCARFKVFYGEKVAAWSVNLGNSPTNNGHGGDLGTTAHASEVQVFDQRLSVYTAAQSARRQVDKLLDVDLPPLAGRGVQFEICDQVVSVELLPSAKDPRPPKWRLETQNARLLFALGPEVPGTADSGGSIYAAFNRVVHVTSGAPSHQRVGNGVKRVEVELIP